MNEFGLELSGLPGVSGAFLRDRKRFNELWNRFREFDQRRRAMSETEKKLAAINDPAWLRLFERRRLHGETEDMETTLRRKAEELETRLAQLAARADKCRQDILSLEPHAFDVRRSLVGPEFVTSDCRNTRALKRNSNVEARNAVIDCFLNRPDVSICSELDSAFPSSPDGPSPQLPVLWFARFDVKTFQQAYADARCKPLVQSMISKRRRKNRFPV